MKATNSYEVYAKTERPEMMTYVPTSAGRVLDVGCSVGNFGAAIKALRGITVWGVEIDPNAAEKASSKLDRVIVGAFGQDLKIPKSSFDCIVFNDVLEHMNDPFSALVYARELLSPGGCIVASIPNVRYFANVWMLIVHKKWDYVDAGILDRTHLRFFTINSIRATFENLGYVVDTLVGINPLDEFDRCYVNKFRILNFLSLGAISDMRWLQFAIVAH